MTNSPQSRVGRVVSLSRLLTILWTTVAVLIGIHVVLTYIHYEVHELPWIVRQLFDVDEEDSFPTWYSASALLLTAFVLWVHSSSNHETVSRNRWHWMGLTIGFLLLSIDEIAGVHESLNSVTEMSWAIPGGIFAGSIGLAYVPFLWALPRRTAVRFAFGGAVFIGGAIGVELFTEPFLANDALDTMPYNIWNALEEGMEMAGVLIFLKGVLELMLNGRESTVIVTDLRS